MSFSELGSLFISFSALIVSIIALVYTIEAFLLKSGHKIRGSISIGSSIECEDHYVFDLTLENIKDKATVIFEIYLKIGQNIYLELESFEESPLILGAFEVYHKEFDPILFYSVNLKHIKIDEVLSNSKIRKKIILSTTSGKYEVTAHIKHWSPTSQYFRNYYTAIIHPQRIEYKGKNYGYNIKYLVDLKYDGNETVIAIHKDLERNRIKKPRLTSEALHSKTSLETFFRNEKKAGNVLFDEIKVLDFAEAIRDKKEIYEEKGLKAEVYGFFQYKIVGRIHSIWMNYSLWRKNRKLRNERKKELNE